MNEEHYKIAILIARVFLGVLFFMQGYDKVFGIGLKNITESFKKELGNSILPGPIITLSAYYTSFIELIGGFFLILGFMKYYTLYALGLDLILVAVAMGMIEPLWKMDFVFPRLALILFLLVVPAEWDTFCLDTLLLF
jgi:uncharacterized membrane protein YphA (DoxX/SURF4 family)